MNTAENWGLFSPQAEAHLQSVMGLQTWDSIRALDFLIGLPDVDSDRIGVTGASGGGTQTFVLCAIDPRPTVAFPAVMVSTAMQGGCTCENASLLRVETGNVEFAALFAPKPLGMTAADDWTHEMASKGFPELQKHYQLLGAPDRVSLKPLLHFGHNYNYVSRAALYSWFNKHLKLGLEEPVVEEGYRRLTAQELTVWDSAHPKPRGGPELERDVLSWWTEDARRQIDAAASSDESLRNVIGAALDVVIGRNLATAGAVEWKPAAHKDRGSYSEDVGLLRNASYVEELPAVILRPKESQNKTAIWCSASGKSGLYKSAAGNAEEPLKPEVRQLLQAGVTVIGVDLLSQGEFLPDNQPLNETRTVKNPREAPAYTYCYNRALFAERTHDLLTAIKYVKQQQPGNAIDLVALDETGPIAAAARAQSAQAIEKAAINTAGFRFGRVLNWRDPNFLPGGAKYGDVPGLLALGAPGKLWLAGEGETLPNMVKDAYERANKSSEAVAVKAASDQAGAAAVEWLVDRK
jgi:dienelactone hydrolase